jgi:TRAP-type mannitol/chloroaromatic compound transport system permease small subunit
MSPQSLVATLNKIVYVIDTFSEWTGKLVAWVVLAMVLLVSYDVAMRYFFRSGSVALQELEWHFFSIIFLIGGAYTLKHDDHVRLDLFYKSHFMDDLRRAWINLIGSVLFLIPFCALIIICSWPLVTQSFTYAEASPDPGGLTHRWILKCVIPAGFGLLLIHGIGDAIRNLIRIVEGPS